MAVSEKSDGSVGSLKPSKEEIETRRKLLRRCGFSLEEVIELNQVHGNRVFYLTQDNCKLWIGKKIPATDGVMTRLRRVPILLKTADCLPLVFFDSRAKGLAVVHCGWRGATKEIHLAALRQMKERFNTKFGDVFVWIGPAIRGCCFTSRREPRQKQRLEFGRYIEYNKDKWMVDFVGFVKHGLVKSGVKMKRIVDSRDCTYHGREWFSYQRHKIIGEPNGQEGTIVWLS